MRKVQDAPSAGFSAVAAMAVTMTVAAAPKIQPDARAIVARSIAVIAIIVVVAAHRAATMTASMLVPATTVSHVFGCGGVGTLDAVHARYGRGSSGGCKEAQRERQRSEWKNFGLHFQAPFGRQFHCCLNVAPVGAFRLRHLDKARASELGSGDAVCRW